MPFLNLLCHSKTDARFMQDAPKAVWSIPYVSVAAFFPNLKQNFIAYSSSKVSDCIFEIRQLWQSGFSRVYSNCCCSSSFEAEIIKIGESSHKMYCNNTQNFQVSTIILDACTKKSGNLLRAPRIYHIINQNWHCCELMTVFLKYRFICFTFLIIILRSFSPLLFQPVPHILLL